jgi:hypothetical protein
VFTIERRLATQGHTHTMQENWKIFAQLGERSVGSATFTHQVLGMHLEKANAIVILENINKMFGLETSASLERRWKYGQAKPRYCLTRKVDHLLRLPRFCD